VLNHRTHEAVVIAAGRGSRIAHTVSAPGMLKEQLSFGVPLGLSTLTLRINKQADNYIVAFAFSSAVFVEYTVGSWEIPMVLRIPYAITAAYMTTFTRLFDQRRFEELHRRWMQMTEKVTLLIVPIAMCFLVFADDVVCLLFGSQFPQAVVVFQIYTFTLLTRVSSYSGLLKCFGDSRFVFRTSVLLVVLNVVFTMVGIQILGLYGAPLGASIAHHATLWVSLRRIAEHVGVPMRRLIRCRFYLGVLALALITALVVRFGLLWLGATIPVQVAVSIPLYLAGFTLVAGRVRLIDAEDRRFVLSLLPLRRRNVNEAAVS
jgi:O-antigen/teichoic acid export membrane protein